MPEQIEIKVHGSPREEMIRTAVNFLTSPKVQESPASQKEAFLKKKGLTTEEIKIAFEKSSNHVIAFPDVYRGHLSKSESSLANKKLWWFYKFKSILHTAALMIGITYSLFYLYKKFVEPFLLGKGKKPKSVEASINNLNKSVEKSIGDLKNDMAKVQCELERIITLSHENQKNSRLVNELKSDIATVKGLLLSRHQFSTVNLSGPSIPAWQLTQASQKDDKENLENEENEHNSGSSETEIVPNLNSNGGSQGSDSSLEMIKEVDS